MGKRVLLLNSDDLLRRSLGEQLAQQEDFDHVATTISAVETIALLQRECFDSILLDMVLSDENGHDFCRMMRDHGVRIPIIMLTNADRWHATRTGLETGANDYVTKPFRLNVLLARMRIHMRSRECIGDTVFPIAHYIFQPAAKLLMDDKCRIRLTEKEVAILNFLLRASNGTVPRGTILHEVWGYTAQVTTHTLETHIYHRLQQKMEQDPSKARILLTTPGGYRLVS